MKQASDAIFLNILSWFGYSVIRSYFLQLLLFVFKVGVAHCLQLLFSPEFLNCLHVVMLAVSGNRCVSF